MQLYRYFKGHEKRGHWYPFKVGSGEEKTAFEAERFGFCTVLGVASESADPEKLTGDLYYQGPFYLDIDFEGNLKKSIDVAKACVKRLTRQGVREDFIDIWLSGKKGLHITVPQAVFTEDRPVMDLPHVYKHLARKLGMADLDWSVYSRGKGRMWRLPSRLRIDNQKYKVIISSEELMKLTVQQYDTFVTVPSRDCDVPYVNGSVYPALQTLFKASITSATEERPAIVTLIDDNMRDALGADLLPPCARELRDAENIRQKIGFNEKSIQMMKAVRAFVPGPQQQTTLEEFAVKASGESYATEASRLDHVKRSFGSVASGSDYSWSCRSILSVLERAPCEECPLCYLRFQQDAAADEEIARKKSVQATDEEILQSERDQTQIQVVAAALGGEPPPDDPPDEALEPAKKPEPKKGQRTPPLSVADGSEGLVIHDNAYCFLAPKDGGLRRVTNFTIRIIKVYVEHVANFGEDRRVAIRAEVYVGGRYSGQVVIEEDSWNSNASFTGAFNGISNATFYGKDEDVRRMKSSLMKDVEKTATVIKRVHSYGIHYNKVGGQDVYTYVEPGWSIDNYGNEDLYALSGKLSGAPALKNIGSIDPAGDAETTLCLQQLIRVNQRHAVGLLLGWNMACFLTAQIFTRRNEFPLVSLWGNAESGKTQTSGLFAALHGVHYLGSSANGMMPVSLGGSGATTFAVWTSLSESMSAPKLIEEFNLRSLGKKYEEYAEHFKKGWNRHGIKRGTIRQSKMHGTGPIDAYTLDIPITAPMVIISEQSIQIPALVQRCIQIQMNEDMRRGPGMEASFIGLKRHYTYLDHFAKTAYLEALSLSADTVDNWIKQWIDKVPMSIGDRPHYSFCVALAGLSFLLMLDEKYNLQIKEDVDGLIEEVIEQTNMGKAELAQRKSFSEVDRLMNEFAVMAEISSKQEGSYKWLAKGQYYIREGEYMYLDAMAAHANYMRYAQQHGQLPIIQTYTQFKELVRHVGYCETIAAVKEGFARNRPVLKLNISKMAARGIEVGSFE